MPLNYIAHLYALNYALLSAFLLIVKHRILCISCAYARQKQDVCEGLGIFFVVVGPYDTHVYQGKIGLDLIEESQGRPKSLRYD